MVRIRGRFVLLAALAGVPAPACVADAAPASSSEPATSPAPARAGPPGPPPQAAAAREPLVLVQDTVLEPGRSYGPLVIAASGITVDGNGAVIEGADAGAPRDCTGVGIDARGVSRVTLRNVTVRGFRLGLRVQDAAGWTIAGNDFSDNFHDPDFGWGEQEPGGGIALTDIRDFVLRDNVARRNWDACRLVRCNDSTLEFNDFSHASNTGLKLWNSSRNTVRDNDLSWGQRIAPGETHARDSTCVLIESGSDDNDFSGNDATHGGDGIFIRVLNGWTSRRNVFRDNDASWANNNGFEAWAPENTYVANVANHCSYGFWLGASDRTTLVANEAGWNGLPDGFHNAPESFGHGGIVFVNGPSSHTLALANHCHDNAGGGIVLRGDVATRGAAWKAYHWVLEGNVLERNRWGLFLQDADWIDLRGNRFADNTEGDVHDAGGVTNLFDLQSPKSSPNGLWLDWRVSLRGPAGSVRTGERVPLLAVVRVPSGLENPQDQEPYHFRWDLGDGTVGSGTTWEHAWARPGRQRVGVTADIGAATTLAALDVLVVDDASELGPGRAAAWRLADETGGARATFMDDADALVGGSSVLARIEPDDGGRAELLYPASRDLDLPLGDKSVLRVWLKVRNPNIPAWQGPNPVITLHESTSRWRRLTPDRDWLGNPAMLEARDDWNLIEVPLAGDAHWTVEDAPPDADASAATRSKATRVSADTRASAADGAATAPATLQWLVIGLDSWGRPPLDVRVDGLVIR